MINYFGLALFCIGFAILAYSPIFLMELIIWRTGKQNRNH